VLLALLAAAAQGGEVYRSKNSDGSVTYSDRPTNDNSEYVTTVQGSRAAGAQTTAAQRTRPGAQNAAPRPPDPAPEAAAQPAPLPTGPTAADLREKRQKNCDIAKEREQRYEVSRRLFKTNEKGEREYLDDKAVAEAKAKAAQDVKDWCG
jgi:2-oxoglutarate dehydrogenase complex dehydrogenase (E1) component-like enzyme